MAKSTRSTACVSAIDGTAMTGLDTALFGWTISSLSAGGDSQQLAVLVMFASGALILWHQRAWLLGAFAPGAF